MQLYKYLHNLLSVFVQIANKLDFKTERNYRNLSVEIDEYVWKEGIKILDMFNGVRKMHRK
jgi:hypothetical protein